MEDKRKKSDMSSIFLRGKKVPSYNFSDMKKTSNDNNTLPKIDLRNKKK